jgi:hypothetical protein
MDPGFPNNGGYMGEPFAVKDCALITIATGERAQNLQELKDRLMTTHQGCIYYHFWGGLLRASFDDPEYQNDFAAWAWRGLHDAPVAERLALIDPCEYLDLEDLRRELIDVIEERLEETEHIPWARTDRQFHLMRSQIIVFDTSIRIPNVEDLALHIPRLSRSSIFYHFIDARRRTTGRRDDFSEWLMGFGDELAQMVQCLAAIDPYFSTLTELRNEIAENMNRCVYKGR